jgi:hypothetical protein
LTKPAPAVVLRVASWALAALVLAFLGPFFVEHLGEWFLSGSGMPPPRVWVAMTGHLAILAGCLALVFLPRAGSALLAAGVAVFMLAIFDADVLWIGAVALSPAVPALASVVLARRSRSALPDPGEEPESGKPR